MFSLERCETVKPAGRQCGGQALWVWRRGPDDWLLVCASCADTLIRSGAARLGDTLRRTP